MEEKYNTVTATKPKKYKRHDKKALMRERILRAKAEVLLLEKEYELAVAREKMRKGDFSYFKDTKELAN